MAHNFQHQPTIRTAREVRGLRTNLFVVTILRVDPKIGHNEIIAYFGDGTINPRELARHWVHELKTNFGVGAEYLPAVFADRPGWELTVSQSDANGIHYLAVVHPGHRKSEVLDIVTEALVNYIRTPRRHQ